MDVFCTCRAEKVAGIGLKKLYIDYGAMCLLNDLEMEYAKDDLPILLSGFLDPELQTAAKMKRLEELCEDEVVGPVIVKYGFDKSAAGIKEMNSLVFSFSETDDALKKKLGKVEAAASRLRRQ